MPASPGASPLACAALTSRACYAEALAARGVRFDAPAQPEVGRLHAPLRRTGSSHGRSTVDSLAAWCPRGRGSGAGEAEAAALPGLLTPPLPLDGFEFCEPRYGWGDVRPGRRRGREASLAEWVGAAGGEAEHGVEAGVRAARGDRPLTGVASLQGIAEAWLASDTDFLHCDFDCQCDTAEAVSAAWRHDGADSGGRQMGAWWRRRLVRLGIALAAFAGGFAAASLGLRRLRL